MDTTVIADILDYSAPRYKGKLSSNGSKTRPKFSTIDDVFDNHFAEFSDVNHPCRHTLFAAAQMLNGKAAYIVETGSAAWGTKSSILFDSYVNSFGGKFISVDIRLEPLFTLNSLCTEQSTFYCDDSVAFLKRIANEGIKPDLFYLDSWDLDINDPLSAAIHGLHEFLAILPILKPGTVLLIDDTPKDSAVWARVQGAAGVTLFEQLTRTYGFPPGKGALVKDYLLKNGMGREVAHDYQLLWEF